MRTVAIIGGQPAQFRGLIDRYRETGARAGHAPEKLTVGVYPIGFLAETSARAAETFWPAYRETFGRIGRERGWAPPTRPQFDARYSPAGALLVGGAEGVAEKVVSAYRLLGGLARLTVLLDNGALTHRQIMRAIELRGTGVAPLVNRELAAGRGVEPAQAARRVGAKRAGPRSSAEVAGVRKLFSPPPKPVQRAGMLIAPARLLENLQRPDWVVFDCRHDLADHGRGARVYGEGHIPGAFFAPVETALAGAKTGQNGRHPLPVADAFADFLGRHGVDETTQIVAYDDVGGQYAARLWWLARWIGLTRVGVLDGGWPKWIAQGGPVTADVPSPRALGKIVARAAATMQRSTADVLDATTRAGGLVLDARAPERYRGQTEPIDRVAGHIPAAVNRFFKLNLNSDLTMRSPAELRGEFTALLGPWRPDQVIHQCGSGVTACVNLLAMEHAGLGGSALYAGSWSEWISDTSRPVARDER